MQQKLKSIQTAITKRETLCERIIARRVEQVLNLDQGAEPSAIQASETQASGTP